MSNYYTQFCTAIKASNDDADWCEKHMALFGEFECILSADDLEEGEDESDFIEYQSLCKLYGLDDGDCSPDFEWEYDEDSGLFILSATDHGKPEHAATFLREYLRARHPKRCHYFTWANGCSRTELGAFGGGGVFITANSIEWNIAHIWAEEKSKEFEKSK